MSDAMFAPLPPALPAPVRPRVVALLNQKGGVGKTTSTVNLGAALARLGLRTLLVDLDPQSNLSLHFGVEASAEQPSVHDLLVDPQVRLDEVVVSARPGLDFVPAVTELALVEGELAGREGMQGVLREKLEPGFSRYDAILLDCPPSLGVLSVNALTVADEVFVPMQAHYLPLRGLEKLLQTVHLVSQGLNPRIEVSGVLLCMHDGSSSHARAVIEEIEAQFAQYRDAEVPWSRARVLAPPVRRNIKLAEAPSFGKTIFDYAPRSPGAQDYRAIAESLLERWGLAPRPFEGAHEPAAEAERSAESAPAPAPRARRTRGARAKARTPVKVAKAAKPAKRTKGAKRATAAKRVKVANPATPAKPAKRAKAGKIAKATKVAKAPKRAKFTSASKPAKSTKGSKPSKSAKPTRGASTARAGRGARATARRRIRSGGLSL